MSEVYVLAGLLGLCIGSFANVVIHRLPRKEEGLSVANPPLSFCPACKRTLPWYENIPLLAWLLLRGRCSGCKAPISPRYPLVEAAMGLLFLALAAHYGPDGRWGALGVMVLFAFGLVVVALVDFEHFIIPDEITVTGMMLAPALCLAVPDLHAPRFDLGRFGADPSRMDLAWLPDPMGFAGWWLDPLGRAGLAVGGGSAQRLALAAGLAGFVLAASVLVGRRFGRFLEANFPDENLFGGWPWGLATAAALGVPAATAVAPGLLDQPRFLALAASIAGMGLSGGAIYALGRIGTRLFRREAMGFGDVKLLGLIGAILGWKGALLSLLLGSFGGAAVGLLIKAIKGESYIPFGPYLAAGAVAAIFAGERVLGFFLVSYPDWVFRMSSGG